MIIELWCDLLTWKHEKVEENMLLEFAQQYKKLTDEEKAILPRQPNRITESMYKISSKGMKKGNISIAIYGLKSKNARNVMRQRDSMEFRVIAS